MVELEGEKRAPVCLASAFVDDFISCGDSVYLADIHVEDPVLS